MRLNFKIILALCCCWYSHLQAQQHGRSVQRINDQWQFIKDSNAYASMPGNKADPIAIGWQNISLPHTWNVNDVMDDEPGYYRGVGWYKRNLQIDPSWKGKQLYLFFEGANQQATVFINNKKAGHHDGGYTGFTIPISEFINWKGDNQIEVRVDNSHNKHIPPLTADFTFYGGIYRDVWLQVNDAIHFNTADHGSKGIYITTPVVNKKQASVDIKGTIVNDGSVNALLKVHTIIRDKKGKKVADVSSSLQLNAGASQEFNQSIPNIKNPHCWSPEDPYLYTAVTTVSNNNMVVDEVTNPVGFRWFSFDAEKGFILNGKPYKLVGASRHQDYQGLGNAVPDSLAVKDLQWLKEMGGNFLRVAHYPQDPVVLQTCDEIGIIASVEIPIVNEITESDSFFHNCARMQVEMIRQHYNHPSVVMWCLMNEVLLRPQFNSDKERQKVYFSSITKLAKMLDSLTRKEDPTRYTMIAHHGDYNRYRDVGLVDIPMIVGWNLYSGWYGANLKDFPVFLDQFHKNHPNKPMMVTEYGADADPRIRSNEPVRFDKSVEYTTTFHQYYLDEMLKRPFVAAAMIWNLADFNSETRTESMPHINNKGLLQWDRTPKDPYYYYQAILQKKPFVKILGSSVRAGIADSASAISWQTIQVASNIDEVELLVNDKPLESKKISNGLCEWKLPLADGFTNIQVRARKNGKEYADFALLECRLQPYRFIDQRIPFRQLNVLLGANRFFIDNNQQLWIPAQNYQQGSWGWTGGKVFKLPNSGRLPYGTDKNIIGTDNDPLYQTQVAGIGNFKLDVPPGEYELTLHFAELQGGPVKELVYNLGTNSGDRIEPTGKRIFDMYVNGDLLLDHFNIAEQYGLATAVSKTWKIKVNDASGIDIVFKAIEGDPVLNALQLKKLDPGVRSDVNIIR